MLNYVQPPVVEHMFSEQTSEPAKQQALTALTASFIAQGHPSDYAVHMATAVIFQADLELRNAQLARLLAWLKHDQAAIYPAALAVVEQTREEFERRVQQG
jgi:hypothetical protein